MAARSFLGAGDIYIERLVAGVSQGLVGPIYAEKFEIKPNVEKKESTSKGKNDYGQVLESVSIAQPADLTLELKEVVGDILVMAFLGTSATLTQASGTMTDQAFTAKKGSWVQLNHKNLDATITIENSGGTVTYVENTDYVLNRDTGWIKILTASAIADNASLLASGAYGAASGTVISGATQTEVRAKIFFDGKNQADGSKCLVTVWEAIVAADSAFDFLADDFGTVSLTGSMKTPVGKTEPFIVELQPVA